ncbi:MAG: restriction endonuclease subunit S [Verrucomicrobiae bacterium]|nr:restriction endonuclease subunit S [Verrucomicrobiae bacterium]MCP5532292.1 restriction endonuclease subunit S [Akkermansiaceae bacterium]
MPKNPSARLGEIARILTGYTFRTRIEDDPGGSFLVIQGKDIRSDRSLDTENLTRIHLPQRSHSDEEKWVKPGDVLLMTRGDYNYGVFIDTTLPPTVTQNSFCTLRVNENTEVYPDFLATILNQPTLQGRLKSLRSGSSIPNITLGALRELEIPLPPLSIQSEIVHLSRQIHHEKALSDQLHIARLRQLDALAASL